MAAITFRHGRHDSQHALDSRRRDAITLDRKAVFRSHTGGKTLESVALFPRGSSQPVLVLHDARSRAGSTTSFLFGKTYRGRASRECLPPLLRTSATGSVRMRPLWPCKIGRQVEPSYGN